MLKLLNPFLRKKDHPKVSPESIELVRRLGEEDHGDQSWALLSNSIKDAGQAVLHTPIGSQRALRPYMAASGH